MQSPCRLEVFRVVKGRGRGGGGRWGRDFPWLQVHDPQRGKKEKIEPKGPPSCSIYCLHVLIPGTLKKIEVTAILKPSMILAL